MSNIDRLSEVLLVRRRLLVVVGRLLPRLNRSYNKSTQTTWWLSECIYIRKALDPRSAIKEERKTGCWEWRKEKTPIERIQESYIYHKIEIGPAHLVLRAQGSARPSRRRATGLPWPSRSAAGPDRLTCTHVTYNNLKLFPSRHNRSKLPWHETLSITNITPKATGWVPTATIAWSERSGMPGGTNAKWLDNVRKPYTGCWHSFLITARIPTHPNAPEGEGKQREWRQCNK